MSNNKLLNLQIITPEGIIREISNLTAVNIPLVNDYLIGIRPGHAPLIAETRQGNIHCRMSSSEETFELHGGILEVRNNQIIIFSAGEVFDQTSERAELFESTYDRLMHNLLERINNQFENSKNGG